MLDAGRGLGREVRRMCEANPLAEVVGLELTDVVELPYKDLVDLRTAHLVEGDILHFEPFRSTLSSGGGRFTTLPIPFRHSLCWFAASLQLARSYSTCIAEMILFGSWPMTHSRASPSAGPGQRWRTVKAITDVGRQLHELKAEVVVREDILGLGIPAGCYDLHRLLYNYVFKCFWKPDWPATENNLVNFDWYHLKHAYRHTVEEVKGWIEELGLSPIHFREEPSGITVRAQHPRIVRG